jgi:hypothetical protein
VGFDLAVARRDWLLIDVLEGHGLRQGNEVGRAPWAAPRRRDRLLGVVTAISAELGPRDGMALPREHGSDNGPPWQPGDRADAMRQRDVHLGQRFWHMLDGLAGIGQQQGALAQITAPHPDVVRRPEGSRQQAKGGSALPPLTVMHSTLRPPVEAVHLLGIDQEDLATTCLQQLAEGDPLDTGRVQRDRRAAPGGYPVGQRLPVGRAGPNAAYRLGGVRRWHRDIMGVCPDVDACGVSVDGSQWWWERACGLRLCLLAWCPGRLHPSLGRDRAASAGAAGWKHAAKRDQVSACHPCCRRRLPGPASPTGTRPHWQRRPHTTHCHPASIPQSTPQFLSDVRLREQHKGLTTGCSGWGGQRCIAARWPRQRSVG